MRETKSESLCSVGGCGRKVEAKEMCNSHRIQWNRYGTRNPLRAVSPKGQRATRHSLALTFKPDEWAALTIHATARGMTIGAFVRAAASGAPLPKEARAWLSAEEFAHVEALAAARGLTVPALVRAVLLWTVA